VIKKTMQAIQSQKNLPENKAKPQQGVWFKMNVAEGHILKKTRQANRQSGGAFRRQHNAPTQCVIK
jgi:hypothetical protein